MARKKLEVTATPNQLESLYRALRAGTPITLALKYAKISIATYYYWVSIASVVKTVQNQTELEELEKLAKSGVSLQEVRDMASAATSQKRTGIDAFIEPTEESILAYKNSKRFRTFADQCFQIIQECDRVRSEVIITSLATVRESTKDRRTNPSGAMWLLERSMPEYFSKITDKKEAELDEKPMVESVKVEWIDSNTDEQLDRISKLEDEITKGLGGKA